MKHFFSFFLFFVFIFFTNHAEAHHHHSHTQTDTLVHGTRSRPNGERSLRESMVLSSEKHLKIKGFGDYERNTADENTAEKVVLRITEGGTLLIGSLEDSVSGEFRITDNTLLIIEDGARLQIEDGSLLIVEDGGIIAIEEYAELVFMGDLAVVLEEGATGYIVGDSDVKIPGMSGDFIVVDDLDVVFDGLLGLKGDEYTNNLVGTVGTTPSGALMYQIPIEVPVGTAGIQPQLSIVYNSQNKTSGILGVGFGLSGLSSISRVGKNFYHDNERTGVELTMDDYFALDGKRLIRTGGHTVIGENGVIYDTEMASFSEIESFGHEEIENISYFIQRPYLGPKEFQVRAKDGSTLYYGTDDRSNSRVRHFKDGNIVISQWHISKMEDANGNYIEYKYNTQQSGGWWNWLPQSDRASQIKEIHYTGHISEGSASLHNKIVFHYSNKPVQRKLYIAGQEIIDGKLLDSIVCFSEGEIVKVYTFEYTGDKKRLAYMREFAPNGLMLGELEFSWQTSKQQFGNRYKITPVFGTDSMQICNIVESTCKRVSWNETHMRVLADIDGDGKADIVGFHDNTVHVSRSRFNYDFHDPWLPWIGNRFAGKWEYLRSVQDINGDGIADFIGIGNGYVVAELSTGHWRPPLDTWTSSYNYGRWYNINHRHLADFNGDGLPDVIVFRSNFQRGDTVDIAINTGTSFNDKLISISTSPIPTGAFNGIGFDNYTLVGDITGDGRADVVVLHRNSFPSSYTVYFAMSNGTSLTPFEIFDTIKDSWINTQNFFLQDVNGDGKADLIFSSGRKLYVALATGEGFAPPKEWASVNSPYSPQLPKIIMMDVNGDGMADVIVMTTNSNGTGIRVLLSTGTEFALEEDWTTDPFWTSLGLGGDHFFTFADMNGDGLPDLVGFANDGVWVSLNQSYFPLLIAVKDTLGTQFTAEYDVLTNSAIYRKGTDLVAFPLMNFQGSTQVCKRLTTRTNDKNYFYEGAKVHRQGRGFLGFSKITETDTRLALELVSEFELNTDYFVNLPKETRIYSTVNNQLLSQNMQANVIKHLDGKRIQCLVSQTTSKDPLSGTIQTTNLTYDTCGNVLTSSTTYYTPPDPDVAIPLAPGQGFQLGSVATTVTTNTYGTYALRNYPNRLETTQTYSKYTAKQDSILFKQHFTYDPKGNLIQKIDRYETDIATITSYEYENPHGVVTKITTSAPGIGRSRWQTFEYDYPQFRFQTSVTTALGTSYSDYDPFGRVISETAIGEQTTTYKYDRFGRLEKVISPEDYETFYTIRREKKIPGIVYTSLAKQKGRPYVKSYLDILGRTVRTETPGFGGGLVITESEYNEKGQLVRTSMPYFEDETPQWTTFEYDFAGRKIEETFEGLTTYYDYDRLTTTIIAPSGQTSSKTYDAAGDLILATDGGGRIEYKYEIPGLVSTIIAPGNAITVITYDEYGRQETITDPNAGTITYTYNAYDQIVTQTDERGYITTNHYDRHGRLEQVDEAYGRITTYHYITSGPNLGRLHSTVCNNETAQVFEYDEFGRVEQFDDIFEGNSLTTRYSYDEYGNLKTYQYPLGYTLYYDYDDNGFNYRIRGDLPRGTEVIWHLHEVNAMGQELSSTVLNLSKNQTYNVFGQPETMFLDGLMDYHYEYDYDDLPTGNMIFRYNPYNDQKDYFEYDHLNRLTTGGMEYDRNGNITFKEGVGEYVYHSEKVHAVEKVPDHHRLDPSHTISYTSFGKIEHIANDCGSGTYLEMLFVYGPDRQRRVVMFEHKEESLIRHYTQNYEHTETGRGRSLTKEYIHSPYGLVAIRNNGQTNAVATDHLGSIVAEYNPRLGQHEYFGYDAWGNRYRHDIIFREEMRTNVEEVVEAIEEMTAEGEADGNRRLGRVRKSRTINTEEEEVDIEVDGFGSISDEIRGDIVVVELDSNRNLEREQIRELLAMGDDIEEDTTFYAVRFYFDESFSTDFDLMLDYFSRGYTGHEHMDMFGLINMNGRMYDPILGRMLSPDPYVPNAGYTQDFNRYTYARNNPLSYIDPSGEIVILAAIIGGLVGAYLGGAMTNDWNFNPAKWDWNSGQTYIGIFGGGLMGAMGGAMLGYSLANAGYSVGISLGFEFGGIATVGAEFLAANGTLMLQGLGYATAAGGGIWLTNELRNKNKQKDPVKITQKDNNRHFFTGTEYEADQLLRAISQIHGVEAGYWKTDRGYYFEPLQGYAYMPLRDDLWNFIGFGDVGYKYNTSERNYYYTYTDERYGRRYIHPDFMTSARILGHTHSHPRDPRSGWGAESRNDLWLAYHLNLKMRILTPSWIYTIGGPGYFR
ncbi:MAG: FG-GAP-like repeat-containing protein [Bacteroidales bacterium]|nr:FG-GAP-like repeat-containing protein [Bacteroidales bacterium]